MIEIRLYKLALLLLMTLSAFNAAGSLSFYRRLRLKLSFLLVSWPLTVLFLAAVELIFTQLHIDAHEPITSMANHWANVVILSANIIVQFALLLFGNGYHGEEAKRGN